MDIVEKLHEYVGEDNHFESSANAFEAAMTIVRLRTEIKYLKMMLRSSEENDNLTKKEYQDFLTKQPKNTFNDQIMLSGSGVTPSAITGSYDNDEGFAFGNQSTLVSG